MRRKLCVHTYRERNVCFFFWHKNHTSKKENRFDSITMEQTSLREDIARSDQYLKKIFVTCSRVFNTCTELLHINKNWKNGLWYRQIIQRIYMKSFYRNIPKDVYTDMLIIALFVITKSWKQSECPPVGKWPNCGTSIF